MIRSKTYIILVIILFVINLLVAAGTIAIKMRFFGDTEFFLTGSTHPVVDISTRSVVSIILILIIHASLCYYLAFSRKHPNKVLLTIAPAILLGITFLSGQNVVKTQDKIFENFTTLTLRETEIKDTVIIGYNLNGYDPKYHFKKEYECYPFCETFFGRSYQTAPNKTFTVFCGLGPLLRLENN